MYRRSGPNPLSGILFTIILGIAGGVFFLFQQGHLTPAAAPETPTPRFIEATPVPILPTAELLSQPFSPSVPRELTMGAVFLAPTTGVRASIVQTYLNGYSWDISALGGNAGHLQGTAWMNTVGNIVLAGHVEMGDGRRGVFAPLTGLNDGDPLFLSQGDERRVYSVREIRSVSPEDLSVIYPSANDQLTLITCQDYDFINDNYQSRLVVIADRVS